MECTRRAAVTAVGLLFTLAIGGPFVLTALGVESLTVGTPGTITYLFEFTDTPTEIPLGIGPSVLGVGALVGLRVRPELQARRDRSYQRDEGPTNSH